MVVDEERCSDIGETVAIESHPGPTWVRGGGTHKMLARSEDSKGRMKRAGVAQSLPSKMESEQKEALENTPAQHGPGKHRRAHMEPGQKKVLGDCGSSLSTITYGFKSD